MFGGSLKLLTASERSTRKGVDGKKKKKTLTTWNKKKSKQKNTQTTLAPVRQYLQASVVPVLLAGLTELATAQPADPVAWLAQYLIDNNPRNKKGEEGGEEEEDKKEKQSKKDGDDGMEVEEEKK